MAKGKKRKAAPGDVATQPPGVATATTCSTSSRRASCCRAPRSSRCAAARRSSRTATRRSATASCGCTTSTSRPTPPAARDNHEPERPRKLLLHRREIERLIGKTHEKGLTLVPTRIYFKGPHAKVEIALAQGKDVGDKREAIKEREMKREMERALRDARALALEGALEYVASMPTREQRDQADVDRADREPVRAA